MKKYIILLSLILVSSTSFAQLTVSKVRQSIVTVGRTSDNYTALFYNPNDSTYIISIKTSNQFDDSMILPLGTKEEAMMSIRGLAEIMNSGDVSLSISLGSYAYSVTNKEPSSKELHGLRFSSKKHAGISWLYPVALKAVFQAIFIHSNYGSLTPNLGSSTSNNSSLSKMIDEDRSALDYLLN